MIFLPIQYRMFACVLSVILSVGTLSAKEHDNQEARFQIEANLAAFKLDSACLKAVTWGQTGYREFYEGTALSYKYISSLDPKYLRQFRANWKSYEQALDSLADQDTLKQVLRAELHAKRAALEFMDGKHLTAVRFAQSCRNLIKRNRKKFGETAAQQKLLGLFNVVLGAVPRKYQWLSNMLGLKGNVETGLQQLEVAAKSGTVLPLEAEMIAFYVEKGMLSRQEEAIARMERIREQRGAGMLLDYSLSSAYLNLKQNDRALLVLEKRNQYLGDKNIFFIPYWDYLQGRGYYYKADYSRAQIYLSRFLKNSKGTLFRTDATFRLGMALTLSGSYSLGKHFFTQISEEAHSGFDEDEYAQYMANQFADAAPGTHVVNLFRARNYFDGGYFKEGLAILNDLAQKNTLNDAEKTELHYRNARILHGQGKYDLAIAQYESCVKEPVTDQLWLQAYSEYYQGVIARQRSSSEVAREHFKKAMGYDKYFYQAGLENRCRAALSELRRQ